MLNYLMDLEKISDKMAECFEQNDNKSFLKLSEKYMQNLSRNISNAIGSINIANAPFIIIVLTDYLEKIGEFNVIESGLIEELRKNISVESFVTQTK